MRDRHVCRIAAAGFVCGLLVGCAPKMTREEFNAMKPERPAELETLNKFVGKWELTADATLAGLDEKLPCSGSSESRWEGGGWYLVSHGTYKMDEMVMSGMETWAYDAAAKKYRSAWVDNMGGMSHGEATYDAETDTFHMKGTGHGAFGDTSVKGWVKFTDANHNEWWFAEYMGLTKTMEMTGTGKRVE